MPVAGLRVMIRIRAASAQRLILERACYQSKPFVYDREPRIECELRDRFGELFPGNSDTSRAADVTVRVFVSLEGEQGRDRAQAPRPEIESGARPDLAPVRVVGKRSELRNQLVSGASIALGFNAEQPFSRCPADFRMGMRDGFRFRHSYRSFDWSLMSLINAAL
jgi:hypothetical protein